MDAKMDTQPDAKSGAQMDRATFERRLAELSRSYDDNRDNAGCVQCVRCERCVDCTFCVECKSTRRSSYCEGCVDCVGCTRCTRSSGLSDCQHCVECKACVRCAYVVRSVGCNDCTYCFGCVGLSGKDFHILNEKYDRNAYFTLVGKLQKELGVRPSSTQGGASRSAS